MFIFRQRFIVVLLNIAVSTGERARSSQKIRDDIANKYDETYESYLDFLYEVRLKLKDLQLEKRERNILLQEVLKSVYVQNEGKEKVLRELEEKVLK